MAGNLLCPMDRVMLGITFKQLGIAETDELEKEKINHECG
jgi:hypothetical protein